MKILIRNKIYLILVFIVILASSLRFYKIDQIPASLTWDEAAVGYNAFTIANYGKDEYGKSFPLYFKSFGEDKQPIHIYTTAFFVKLFGSNDFTTRFPAALFGVLNVILFFFLSKNLLKNKYIGLLASFFLAISPQNIHFSRFNHEANFALFFFMLGLLLFVKSLEKKKYLLPISVISFFLSTVSYHAAEIVIPIILLLLVILYFKEIFQSKTYLVLTIVIIIGLSIFVFLQPRLFGINRLNQTSQGSTDIEKTKTFLLTHNYFFGRLDLAFSQYLSHFSPTFLFISGDKNPRLSSQGSGEIYAIDGLFIIFGIYFLIKKRSKISFLLIGWCLVGPLPSSLFAEAPHAARAMFMMGGWNLISALGFYSLINLTNKFSWKIISGVVCTTVLVASLYGYINYYYGEFASRYAIDWQYGMKQSVEFIKNHDEYSSVIMTDARSQPYIFFLYYLKIPLPDYLNTVIYNNSISKSYNQVTNFKKFFFEGNLREARPENMNLYIITPSEYDGLRYKVLFDIKQIIYYPNETVAFYIVAAK